MGSTFPYQTAKEGCCKEKEDHLHPLLNVVNAGELCYELDLFGHSITDRKPLMFTNEYN